MRFRAVEFFQTRQYTRIMHAHYTHIYASTDVHDTCTCTHVAPKGTPIAHDARKCTQIGLCAHFAHKTNNYTSRMRKANRTQI